MKVALFAFFSSKAEAIGVSRILPCAVATQTVLNTLAAEKKRSGLVRSSLKFFSLSPAQGMQREV